MGSASEIAVVGYWKFDLDTGTLECDSFFYVPYPMTREVASSKESSMRQFLFRGRSGEVFCFFDNTYIKKSKNDTYSNMNICIINTEANSENVLEACNYNYAEMQQPENWG